MSTHHPIEHREKQIIVGKADGNVVDTEFDSMRDRFESEMRRVEEEMSRLRQEFERNPPTSQQHSPRAMDGAPSQGHHHSTASYETNSAPMGKEVVHPGRPRYDPYLDNLKSPLIRDDTDGKTLRLRFNVKDYLPEEVTVKTVDNRLLVHAKHEEKSANRTVFREYNQEFMLPHGTNAELITSTLSPDGVLTVEAPLPLAAPQPALHNY